MQGGERGGKEEGIWWEALFPALEKMLSLGHVQEQGAKVSLKPTMATPFSLLTK